MLLPQQYVGPSVDRPHVWEPPALTDANEIVAAGALGWLQANWMAIAAKARVWSTRMTLRRNRRCPEAALQVFQQTAEET